MPTLTPDQFADFTATTIAGGAGGNGTSLNPTDTTLHLQTGAGAAYPASGPFRVLLGQNAAGAGEIVSCTSRSGDTLTIVRAPNLPAPDTGTAQTWIVGTGVIQICSAGNLTNLWTNLGYAMMFNVKNYGAKGDGVTDDSTVINTTITAANTAGGGVVFFPAATYAIASTIVPQSGVSILGYGATLLWTGATSGVMVSNTAVVNRFNWSGLGLNGNNSSLTKGFLLQSVTFCSFRDLELNNFSTTANTIAFAMNVSGTGSDPDNGTNSAFNTFYNLQIRTCAIGLQLSGVATHFVTDNRFYDLNIWFFTQTGIDLVQYCDNNYFYATWLHLNANNAVGIIFNDTGTPNADVDADGMQFYGLAIDVQAGVTTWTTILFNWSAQNIIRGFWGSSANVNDAHGISYLIEYNSVSPPQIISKGYKEQYSNAAATPPTLGALQTGVSSQTLTPAGFPAASDRMGVVQIGTAGASPPAAGAVVAIVNWGNAFALAPVVVLNNQTNGASAFVATPSTGGMSVRCVSALAISTTYSIAWFAVGV